MTEDIAHLAQSSSYGYFGTDTDFGTVSRLKQPNRKYLPVVIVDYTGIMVTFYLNYYNYHIIVKHNSCLKDTVKALVNDFIMVLNS